MHPPLHCRLRSLYSNKFEGDLDLPFRQKVGRDILRRYHPDLPHDTIDDGRPSFPDLLRYIADGKRNGHWDAPYAAKCQPCRIRYDYIVQLETQERDAAYIISHVLRGRPGESMNVVSVPMERSGYARRMRAYRNATRAQMGFLRTLFRPDMEMFGYTFNDTSMEGACGGENKCC